MEIQKIRKYGGNVVGVVIILNICEGEYINLVSQDEKIIPVLNIYDIFNYLENNNKIDLFYCERVKFYCEKITKFNIKNFIDMAMAIYNKVGLLEIETDQVKEPFIGQ